MDGIWQEKYWILLLIQIATESINYSKTLRVELVEDIFDLLWLKWLGDKAIGAKLLGFVGHLFLTHASDDDYFSLGVELANLL